MDTNTAYLLTVLQKKDECRVSFFHLSHLTSELVAGLWHINIKTANILALPYLTVCMRITEELLSRFSRNIILGQGCTDFPNIWKPPQKGHMNQSQLM
jgi:hypothetical protein